MKLQACQFNFGAGEADGADHLEYHHAVHTGKPDHEAQWAWVTKSRFCLISLISYNIVTHLVDEGKAVDIVYLNSGEACDTISHHITMKKLVA